MAAASESRKPRRSQTPTRAGALCFFVITAAVYAGGGGSGGEAAAGGAGGSGGAGVWVSLLLLFSGYGAGVAVWQGTCMALFADLWRGRQSAPAFAALKMQSGAASAVAFFVFPSLSAKQAAVPCMACAALGLVCYLRVEAQQSVGWAAASGRRGGRGGGDAGDDSEGQQLLLITPQQAAAAAADGHLADFDAAK